MIFPDVGLVGGVHRNVLFINAVMMCKLFLRRVYSILY